MIAALQDKPKASSNAPPTFTPVRSGLLQRKCACSGTPGPTGECEECRKKRGGMLQLRGNGRARHEVSPLVGEVLGSPGQSLDAHTRPFVEPRFGHDFGDVHLKDSNAEFDRTKLRMSQPGDWYELEADRLADGLLTHFAPFGANAPQPNTATIVNQTGKLKDEGFGDKVTTQPAPASTAGATTQQRAFGANTEGPLRSLPRTQSDRANHLPGSYGPGQPLVTGTRKAVEPLLGYDLSMVRIFPYEADSVAADINARAFTLGRHIYFRQGEYTPGSRDGMRLLLHELVHTTQPEGDGRMLQLTPRIDSWRFRARGNAANDNCCALCPGARLGVDTGFYGLGRFTNGMELQAFIAWNEPGATYDIKRNKERAAFQKIADVWGLVPGTHVGPGENDDASGDDECLTPVSPGIGLPYIYSLDEPGFAGGTGFLDPAATEAVYKASFVEWVEIIPATGGGYSDGRVHDWHSITWLNKVGGAWTVDTRRSTIASGATTIGTNGP